jgi:hypothetical protein
MIGIGLADPNVLQVMDLAGKRQHYLIRALPNASDGTHQQDVWELQRAFWETHGKLEFVALDDWRDLSAFISAVRYFQADPTPWGPGAQHLLELTQRRSFDAFWEKQIRSKAARLLSNLADIARTELGMNASSTIHAGIFVPTGDGDLLDLPFRSDVADKVAEKQYARGLRVLRVNVESPQGVAGLSYARGELVIATPDAEHFDNNFDAKMRKAWHPQRPSYAVVASAPVFDWEHGWGLPIGVAYLTSTNADDLSTGRLSPEDLRFLQEVVLGKGAARVLRLLRKEAAT